MPYLLLANINGAVCHQAFANYDDACGLFYTLCQPHVSLCVLIDLSNDQTIASYEGQYNISWVHAPLRSRS